MSSEWSTGDQYLGISTGALGRALKSNFYGCKTCDNVPFVLLSLLSISGTLAHSIFDSVLDSCLSFLFFFHFLEAFIPVLFSSYPYFGI